MDLSILGDMIQAIQKKEEEDFDLQMQIVAWQTSILANFSGNARTKVKPSDLYTPLEERRNPEVIEPSKTKEELQADLLKAFNTSNVTIK